MSLKYEPASEPLHISVKYVTLCGWTGLLPYLHLPLAGASPPRGSWGQVDSSRGALSLCKVIMGIQPRVG